MLGVFLDQDSLDKDDLNFEELNDAVDKWVLHDKTAASQVIERIKEADVVITNKVVLSATEIAAASKLKLICVAATGTNNVDLEAAKQHGIAVCNVTSYGTNSVVQHVLCLMLMLVRRVPQYQEAVARGDWNNSEQFCLLDYPIEELTGKTLGIIGYGELGKAVANIAQLLGMHVIIAAYKDRQADRYPLNEVLKQSDIVSLHCPLTGITRDLISDDELKMMKSSAFIINAARGGIINEAALKRALENDVIAGAATDVLVTEPPNSDALLLDTNIPNLIVTPHIAWASRQARQNLLNIVADNIKLFFQGSAQNQVN